MVMGVCQFGDVKATRCWDRQAWVKVYYCWHGCSPPI